MTEGVSMKVNVSNRTPIHRVYYNAEKLWAVEIIIAKTKLMKQASNERIMWSWGMIMNNCLAWSEAPSNEFCEQNLSGTDMPC